MALIPHPGAEYERQLQLRSLTGDDPLL